MIQETGVSLTIRGRGNGSSSRQRSPRWHHTMPTHPHTLRDNTFRRQRRRRSQRSARGSGTLPTPTLPQSPSHSSSPPPLPTIRRRFAHAASNVPLTNPAPRFPTASRYAAVCLPQVAEANRMAWRPASASSTVCGRGASGCGVGAARTWSTSSVPSRKNVSARSSYPSVIPVSHQSEEGRLDALPLKRSQQRPRRPRQRPSRARPTRGRPRTPLHRPGA